MLTFNKDLLVGAEFFFAEDGTTVGTTLVSSSSRPTEPTTASGAVQSPMFACISDVKHNPETKDAGTKKCAKSSGGYDEKNRLTVVKDIYALLLEDYNEIVHRLSFGSSSQIVSGTAFKAFADSKREIYGWMYAKMYSQDTLAAGDNFLGWIHWRVKITLSNEPNWQDTYGKPEVSMQVDTTSTDNDTVLFE